MEIILKFVEKIQFKRAKPDFSSSRPCVKSSTRLRWGLILTNTAAFLSIIDWDFPLTGLIGNFPLTGLIWTDRIDCKDSDKWD